MTGARAPLSFEPWNTRNNTMLCQKVLAKYTSKYISYIEDYFLLQQGYATMFSDFFWLYGVGGIYYACSTTQWLEQAVEPDTLGSNLVFLSLACVLVKRVRPGVREASLQCQVWIVQVVLWLQQPYDWAYFFLLILFVFSEGSFDAKHLSLPFRHRGQMNSTWKGALKFEREGQEDVLSSALGTRWPFIYWHSAVFGRGAFKIFAGFVFKSQILMIYSSASKNR